MGGLAQGHMDKGSQNLKVRPGPIFLAPAVSSLAAGRVHFALA